MIRRWIFVALLATTPLAIPGCNLSPYGDAARYMAHVTPVAVVMPPNALSISQQFRPYTHREIGPHDGIDVVGPRGTPVIAAAPGTVLKSFFEPTYGHTVMLAHGADENGRHWVTVYRHLDRRLAEVGQTVARGQQIATMGSTGVLGIVVHLHFELRGGRDTDHVYPVDPQLHWVDGPGMVTCFDPARQVPAAPLRITYPTPCREG